MGRPSQERTSQGTSDASSASHSHPPPPTAWASLPPLRGDDGGCLAYLSSYDAPGGRGASHPAHPPLSQPDLSAVPAALAPRSGRAVRLPPAGVRPRWHGTRRAPVLSAAPPSPPHPCPLAAPRGRRPPTD